MSGHMNHVCNISLSILRRPIIRSKVIDTLSITKRPLSNSENPKTVKNSGVNSDSPSLPSIDVLPLLKSHKLESVNDHDYEYHLKNQSEDDLKTPDALAYCKEDVSHIAPYFKATFNFAAYANKSPLIQELVKLGVELWKIESYPQAMECLLRRNFEDLKPYIQFLHDSGVPPDNIGRSITKNPLIFGEDLDDLHTRIRYLRAHKFSREEIAKIVTGNPNWISFPTKSIDRRLGYFQTEYKLSGKEIRFLASRQPNLITYSMDSITNNTFAVKEQMGFDEDESKLIILNRPNVLMTDRTRTVACFDYAHLEMHFPHEILARMPAILLARKEILQNRHEFLTALGRVQYDPTKPLYVSPDDVACGTDYIFCANVAKTSIELYNMFLKSR